MGHLICHCVLCNSNLPVSGHYVMCILQSHMQPELDPGEEKPEGGGEEEVRAKLEQDQLERQARQRASESAGEDGLVWFS